GRTRRPDLGRAPAVEPEHAPGLPALGLGRLDVGHRRRRRFRVRVRVSALCSWGALPLYARRARRGVGGVGRRRGRRRRGRGGGGEQAVHDRATAADAVPGASRAPAARAARVRAHGAA
ncbi:hypothetical protein BN946_scf184736.g1, partial [Trametes cinnabarina]